MRKYLFAFCSLVLAPSAFAAGTYMGTSGYQSPQRYYQGQSAGGYYQPQVRGASGVASNNYYPQQNRQAYQNPYARRQQPQQPTARQASLGNQGGFYLDAGVSRQYAQWNFDMNQAGSVLNFSDVAWNVLDVKAGYRVGNWILDGGVQYGMQSGTSKMTDDDITAGGLETLLIGTDSSNNEVIIPLYTKALSMGDSKGGSMLGLNVGLGLNNTFGFGKTKIIPSVGYRMMSYKLSTQNNHGLLVTSDWCQDNGNGESVCPTAIWAWDGLDGSGSQLTFGDPNSDSGYYWWEVTGNYVSGGDTMSFSQAGKSHIYEVAWNGPYAALDLESQLNDSNRVTARVELGFPGYESKGDQPYRSDWMHPTSVKDTKGMFGATHLGLGAGWETMIGANWGLSIGVTYDYYGVKDADATTYLNGDYYQSIIDQIYLDGVSSGRWQDDGGTAMFDPDTGDPTALSINDLYASCGDSWTCEAKGEVNSFYRSLGVRVGIVGRF